VTTGERARRYKTEFRFLHQGFISMAVKLGKVTLIYLLSLIVTAILMSQVHACPRGQIRRIHLHRCVGIHSELAAPYARAWDVEAPRHHFSRRSASRDRIPDKLAEDRPWYVDILIPVSAPEPVHYRWEWPIAE
jgi:hypothetical protein